MVHEDVIEAVAVQNPIAESPCHASEPVAIQLPEKSSNAPHAEAKVDAELNILSSGHVVIKLPRLKRRTNARAKTKARI